MKKCLVALCVSVSAVIGTIQLDNVSAQELDGSSGSSSSQIQGSSTEDVVPLVLLITALGGGAVWAIQQGLIPNPLPGIIPVFGQPGVDSRRGDCAPQVFNESLGEWRNSHRTVVNYCDGQFAFVGQNQTDWRVAFEFDGQRWNASQPAGTTRSGLMQGCYSALELRNRGASEDFIGRLPLCAPNEIGYFPW